MGTVPALEVSDAVSAHSFCCLACHLLPCSITLLVANLEAEQSVKVWDKSVSNCGHGGQARRLPKHWLSQGRM